MLKNNSCQDESIVIFKGSKTFSFEDVINAFADFQLHVGNVYTRPIQAWIKEAYMRTFHACLAYLCSYGDFRKPTFED